MPFVINTPGGSNAAESFRQVYVNLSFYNDKREILLLKFFELFCYPTYHVNEKSTGFWTFLSCYTVLGWYLASLYCNWKACHKKRCTSYTFWPWLFTGLRKGTGFWTFLSCYTVLVWYLASLYCTLKLLKGILQKKMHLLHFLAMTIYWFEKRAQDVGHF